MKSGPKFSDLGLQSINWFGLITAILMMLLPFLGPWWVGRAGTGAMEVGLSPFDVNMSLLGLPIQSSLVGLFLLAAKITFIIAGVFMLLSSIFPKQWWSKRLFGFGVMKPFSNVIFFMVPLVIVALLANILLPGLLSSMLGGTTGLQINAIILSIVLIVVFVVSIYALYTLFSRLLSKISRETEKSQLKGNILLTSIFIAMLVLGAVTYPRIPPPPAQVNLRIPYVVGTATSTIQVQNAATITAPITFSLTGIFWLAAATGVLGIIARIYQGRFIAPEETTSRLVEHKVIKLKPSEEKRIIKVKPSEQKKVIKLRPK
jgi:membrane protein implicated in regulation of membrane protease activity